MRSTTPLLLAISPGVTSAALGHMRIRLVSASCASSSQHSSFLQDPLLERVALFCDVPLPPCLRALSSAAPSGTLLLPFATCSGMAPPALPSLLMRRVQWRAHFSSPAGDSLFSDDFYHSLSLRFASLTSLHVAGLMLPSLATTSWLRFPSATSLRQVRTASLTSLIPLVASSTAFLLPLGLALRCGSFHLEVQLSCSGHQARWWPYLS